MSAKQIKKIAAATPDYPGRKQVEDVTAALIGPIAKRASTGIVLRLLGYWVLWDGLHTQGIENPRAVLVEKGIVGRTWSFRLEGDFPEVFGCTIEQFRSRHMTGNGSLDLDLDVNPD